LAESGLQQVDFTSETPEQRAHQQLFRRFLKGDPDGMIQDAANELRSSTLLAGSETPIFTSGSQGGFLVPVAFASMVAEARAAIDPLFSADVCSLLQEDSFKLPQVTIPGWDLTSAIATKNTEGTQHAPDVVPPINGTLTGRHRYSLRLAGSFEFEGDSRAYGSAESALARAIGVAFARGVGADLITGAGGATAPQGALTGAVNSGITTAAAGVLGLGDINNIFFSLNPIYRNSPKCFWVMNDATWKLCNAAVDGAGRPLLPIGKDGQTLKGKPVLLSPSMPTGAGSTGILLGDFSHYYIHASTLLLQRQVQTPGLAEYGLMCFTGLQLVDAVVNDPSEGENSGAFSPIKYATLHA
jgi:HK97 family phage major capsid protein